MNEFVTHLRSIMQLDPQEQAHYEAMLQRLEEEDRLALDEALNQKGEWA